MAGYRGQFTQVNPGYEIFVPNDDAGKIVEGTNHAGANPVGLGARDTLRLEKRIFIVRCRLCITRFR